jgi:hypothetical protein
MRIVRLKSTLPPRAAPGNPRTAFTTGNRFQPYRCACVSCVSSLGQPLAADHDALLPVGSREHEGHHRRINGEYHPQKYSR